MIDISKLSYEERRVVLARREYMRRWKKNNPEKVKKIQERFYQRQAEKLESDVTGNDKKGE